MDLQPHAFQNIDGAELASRLGTDHEPFVLDVREPHEVEEWAIPESVNIPLGQLPDRVSELPVDREVVVVCGAGGRSTRAAEFLSGRDLQVENLRGGMAAWGRVYDRVAVDGDRVRIVQVRRRGKGCLSYVIGAGDEAFVVDPAINIDVYRDVAADHGWRITRVFDTHLHADHLSGARVLAARTGAALHLSPDDTFDFPFKPIRDDERFHLGCEVEVSVAALRSPGHTQGSTVYFIDHQFALTGDTLFVDSVGRPDLAERTEEFAHNLYRSLHERVLTESDDTLVLPGHYSHHVPVHPNLPVGARLGDLRTSLDPLGLDEDAFVEWAATHVAERPPNYSEIIKANMGRSDLPQSTLEHLELGPNRCSV